jgi:3'(2'), 5'-bisphosphate nucleotidase
MNRAELLAKLIPLAQAAGEATLKFYGKDTTKEKADGSPVTAADEAAEAVILPALRALTPEIPVISEEEASKGLSPEIVGKSFWLVDPLDGTKEFINQNGEFTVNIALIVDGVPVLGVVDVPALKQSFAGCITETGEKIATLNGAPISTRTPPEMGLTVVGSRSHGDAAAMDAYLAGLKVETFRAAGSSLKLCLIAEGKADLYPRLGTTMEWDIAAGDAVLRAAGGRVELLDGNLFPYGKKDYRNPHFAAFGNWTR